MVQRSIDDPLFTKNMSYLRQTFPDVSEALSICQFDPRRLLAVGDDWDLLLDDASPLYGCGSREHAHAQAEAFWADVEPHRLTYPPSTHISIDKVANEIVTGCLRQAVDAGVQFFERRCDNSAANAVVFGVGLGQHLMTIVNRSECESIVLIEPNVEFFFYSLFTFDWSVFVEAVREKGGHVAILLGWSVADSAFTIMSWLNNRYPGLVDGTLLYTHYASETLDAIHREFMTKYASQLTMGLGHVVDESRMVGNSVRNLGSFDGRIFRRGAPETGLPAFIVGSGPSFDQSFETVRKYGKHALVISCGTALEVMLKRGVVPDFHTELENVPAAYDVLARCAGKTDIRGVVLIASTTVDPRISSLFDRTLFFVRSGVSSYPLFNLGEDALLTNVAPIVSNLALSFAREAGCRRIYLFGIDLSVKEEETHHSKDSPYMLGEIEERTKKFEIEVPGNFGGTVLTNNIYLLSRTMKEADIAEFGAGVAYYNCSDGARIEGARPLNANDVCIEEGSPDKDRLKSSLLDHFIRYDRSQFDRQWSRKDVFAAIDGFRDRLLRVIDTGGTGYVDVIRILRRVSRVASSEDTWKRTTEEMLFRGTLCVAMGAFNFFLTRTGNPHDRKVFSAIVKENLRSLVLFTHAAIGAELKKLGIEAAASQPNHTR